MADGAPCIVIGPVHAPSSAAGAAADPVALLIEQLQRWQAGGALAEPGAMLRALVAEGRRFAETASGARWRSVLASSAFVANGWLLWNAIDADKLMAAAAPSPDGLADEGEALARLIAAMPAEAILQALNQAALKAAAAAPDG